MGNTIPTPYRGTAGGAPGEISFKCRAVTTTNGTLSTTVQPPPWTSSPLQIAKVAATNGRYTLTLPRGYRGFAGGVVTVIGPDTAVYGAKTKGLSYFFRDVDVDAGSGLVTGALDGTVELQFVNPSTDATNYIDAELPDGTIFIVEIKVAEGS